MPILRRHDSPPPQKMSIHQDRSTKKRNRDEKKKKIIKKGIRSKRKRSSMSLTDLPTSVLVEIIARLPLTTLFVARSVCKTFISLTTPNPHIINPHYSNVTEILIFQFDCFRRPSFLIHMADQVLNYKKSSLKPFFQLPKMDGIVEQYDSTSFLVNSCNGLLYFRQIGPKDSYSLVCNPVTSEYIIIPDVVVDPKMRIHSQAQSLCLGFSPCTNKYKVLRIFFRKNAGRDEVAAQVFVIGSDSWRDIDDPPLHRHFFGWNLFHTQNVNGLMYCYDRRSWPGVIFSFDFEREKFGEVALPPEFKDKGFMTKYDTTLGVLGGCLCVSSNNSYVRRVDLWVMRLCGNRESWRKEFVFDTITLGPRNRPIYGEFMPLQFLGNGEILMQWKRNTLVCYDPRTMRLRYFRFRIGDSGHKVVASTLRLLPLKESGHKVVTLTRSFVPLKDALNVEKVLARLRPSGDKVEHMSLRRRGGNKI